MPNSQAALAGMALAALTALGCALVFHAVPQENRELLSVIVGAIGGALTLGGAQKVAAHIATPDASATVKEGA